MNRAIGAIVLGYLGLVAHHAWVCEDAFISFRYARNLAAGHGPVFNVGERAEGYSNALWVLVAAVVEVLRLDVTVVLPVLSALTGAATLVTVAVAARGLGLDRLGTVAAVGILATTTPFVIWSTSGLETMPFTLAVVATAVGLVSDRPVVGAVAGVALVLLRTEGPAWLAVIGAGAAGIRWAEDRPLRPLLLAVVAPVVVALAHVGWRFAYYGDVLANTASAKLASDAGLRLSRGVRYGLVGAMVVGHPWLLVPAAAVVPRTVRWAGVLALAVAFPAWAAVVGGDYERFFRFLVPSTPFLALALGALVQRAGRGGPGLAVAVAALGVLPAAGGVLAPPGVLRALSYVDADVDFEDGLYPFKIDRALVAHQHVLLQQLADPGERVVLTAVGRNGYHTDVHVLDQCGLIGRYPEIIERAGAHRGKRPGHDACVAPRAFGPLEPDLLAFRVFRLPDAHPADALPPRVKALQREDAHGRYYPVAAEAALDGVPTWGIALRRGEDRADLEAGWAAWRAFLRALRAPDRDLHVSDDGRFTSAPLDEQIAQLEAIGYLSGSTPAGPESGVTVHDPDRAFAGINLVTSGHGPEAALVRLDGTVAHTWRMPFDEAFDRCRCANRGYWRRTALLPDGGVLAVFEGCGMVRLDRGSALVWATCNRAHHDLEVLPDGRIWTLTRKAHVLPSVNPDRPTLEDHATLLAPDGSVLRQLSIVEAYQRSAFVDQWEGRDTSGGDPLHTNTIAVLDGRAAGADPAFAAGNLLLSTRHLHTVAVLDPDAGTIVWSRTGDWRLQHDPHVLDDGRLLLFDNRGLGQRSRLLEVALPSGDIVDAWPEGEAPFFSRTCGTVQPLPNGNRLVTESDGGRAFELAPDGAVVWAYHNPHRPAEHPDRVATLFEVRRVPLAEVPWLD